MAPARARGVVVAALLAAGGCAPPGKGTSAQAPAPVVVTPLAEAEAERKPAVLIPPSRVVCPAWPSLEAWVPLAHRECPIYEPVNGWGGLCREPFCMRPCMRTRKSSRFSVTTRYEYDQRGRLLIERDPRGGPIVHTWDNADRILTTTVGHHVITHAYRDGRYAGHASSEVKQEIEYDARGRVARDVWDGGSPWVETKYSYDAQGRIAEEHTLYRSNRPIGGDETRYAWSEERRVARYGYDAAGRLVKVEHEHTDAAGKREQRPTETRRYDRDGRLIAVSGESELTLRYDEKGRLVEEKSGDETTDYAYECAPEPEKTE